MNYASIKSTSGGKAPQMYPGKQPLNEDKALKPHIKAAKRTSSSSPQQMNTNPKGS